MQLAQSLPKQTAFIVSALFRAFDSGTQKQGGEEEKLWTTDLKEVIKGEDERLVTNHQVTFDVMASWL